MRTISHLVSLLVAALCPFVAALALGAAPAHAHPHVWIDLRSKVVFDDQGRVTALRVDWLFDEFYSAYAVAAMKRVDGVPDPADLMALARINLDNLREYAFFTDVRADGRRIVPKRATDPASDFDGKRLRLAFTVPLPEPLDPRKQSVTFAVYDPTYYIEIAYLPGDPVGLLNAKDTGCAALIEQPDPSPEARNLAGAYGRDESIDAMLGEVLTGRPGTTIGELFAEKAVIRCR